MIIYHQWWGLPDWSRQVWYVTPTSVLLWLTRIVFKKIQYDMLPSHSDIFNTVNYWVCYWALLFCLHYHTVPLTWSQLVKLRTWLVCDRCEDYFHRQSLRPPCNQRVHIHLAKHMSLCTPLPPLTPCCVSYKLYIQNLHLDFHWDRNAVHGSINAAAINDKTHWDHQLSVNTGTLGSTHNCL